VILVHCAPENPAPSALIRNAPLKNRTDIPPLDAGNNAVWISPSVFEHDLKPRGWPDDPDLRRAVDWLLTFLQADDWRHRRFATLRHFLDTVTGSRPDRSAKGRFFNDKDQFAWYLFLGQAYLDHPTIYDHIFGSRVIPVLTSIGRNLELLKDVAGIESRVLRMVGPEKAQPNACLFELLVAAAYRRAGAVVEFLEERPGVAKTHDINVSLKGINWAVECKRMEVGEYTERERSRARELWLPVARAFHQQDNSVFCVADFLVELSTVPNDYLAQKARQWVASGRLAPLNWSDSLAVGQLQQLDLSALQRLLVTDDVAMNSSRLHELLTGRHKRNAHIISSLRVKFADNPIYIQECDAGCVFDWDSRSIDAIDGKARDVLKRLADACSQLPDGRPSIVHIGFEAVDGSEVEAARYEKVIRSIARFDPLGKALEYVYVSWFAPESPPDTSMAFDETCHWQAVRPKNVRPLEDGLMVLPPEGVTRSGAHWKP